MKRNILSSRVLIVGIIFFVFVVVGSQFYSWHVRRTVQKDMALPKSTAQHLENEKASNDAQLVEFLADTEALGGTEPSLETEDTQHVAEAAEAFTEDDLSVANDMLDMFIEATDATEEAPYGVSLFGFGPFPEIPPDYPDQDIWDDIHISTGMEPYSELVIRTRIALWNQGVRTVGAVRDNTYNLIYPIIDDVVYIKWADNLGPDGEPYVQRVLTSPATDDSYDLHKGIFPPYLTVYEFPDGGIDPYDFLGLPRKGE